MRNISLQNIMVPFYILFCENKLSEFLVYKVSQ